METPLPIVDSSQHEVVSLGSQAVSKSMRVPQFHLPPGPEPMGPGFPTASLCSLPSHPTTPGCTHAPTFLSTRMHPGAAPAPRCPRPCPARPPARLLCPSGPLGAVRLLLLECPFLGISRSQIQRGRLPSSDPRLTSPPRRLRAPQPRLYTLTACLPAGGSQRGVPRFFSC